MQKKSSRAVALLSALLFAGSAAGANPTYDFDIRSATLEEALKQFAAQTGLQIAYFTRIAEGRTAPSVSGKLTAEQALSTLLNASGLIFERIDAETLAIRGARSTPAAAPVSGANGEALLDQNYSLRLASAPAAGTPAASTPAPAANRSASSKPKADSSAEVVVTGSHIRGVVNDTAPMMTFDREYIQRSGFSNMQQLVESLPMNFKGGMSGSTEVAPFGLAPASGQNLTRGTGFNLRGLGSVSTLTLINGRRVAPSGQGSFVDVSTIPLSAVERIEILTDGASAIYGADAVAGVVNIILRKNFSGAETSLKYGQAADGALDEQRLSQTLGASWGSGNALLVLEGYKRDPLDVKDRQFITDAGTEAGTYLLPRRKLGSLLFGLNQDLPANLDFATNVLYSYEEVDSMNTNGNTLQTQTPITNQWSVAAGLGYEPFADWRFSLDGTIAEVKPKTGFTYMDIPTQTITLLITDYIDDFDTWSMDLKADGSLFELPAGKVRLAVGASYRDDDLRSTRIRRIPNTGFEVRAIDSRDVKSVFGEVYVPIVGAAQGLSWAKRIELSVAGRYDDYSDFGSTANPKVGLVWSPIDSLDIRGSYSTSFRAPTVAEKAQVTRGVQISTGTLDDPNGGVPVPIFYLNGSLPLDPEEADTIAFGFTLRPAAVQGLEIGVNYFDIDYTNRITAPGFDTGALSRRADFGDLLFDIANDAAAQAYLDSHIAAGDLYIDWEGTGATGVRHVFDLRQKNAARSQVSGFDVTTSYAFQRGADAFDLGLSVTHLKEILTSLTSDSTTFDQVDSYNQPLDWRARLMGTWIRGGLTSTLVMSYADNYTNTSFAMDIPVASWTTVDVNVSYDFTGRSPSAFLDGTKLALGVSNLLDKDPPPANSPLFPVGYDVFNADAMGRFVSASYTKRW